MLYDLYLTSDELKDIDDFLDGLSIIYAQRSYGTCINGTSWGWLKDKFDELNYRTQSYISTLSYNHGNEVKGSIGEFLDYYDRSLLFEADKYGNLDFIGRKQTLSFVKTVEDLIDEIGTVTVEKEDLIVAARSAVDNLTEAQLQHFNQDKFDILVAAEETLKKLKVQIIPLQQEAIDGDYTYVRFVFILSGYPELSSSDFENKLTLILDDGEQTKTISPNAYNKLTHSGETYTATVNEKEYSFDNSINENDIYVIYVVKFTTAKYQGHNVKAKLSFNENEYITSGYTFE